MKVAVLTFPGSNCDHDCLHAVTRLGHEAISVWHTQALPECDAIILPGGFSYGDYLRCGAIARFSPVIQDVKKAAAAGKPILGICNGFQILIEAGLLPGALMRNQSLRFMCKEVNLRLENNKTPFTGNADKGTLYRMPIAHAEGNFFADERTLAELENKHQVVFRYCDANGATTPASNPNGALHAIAGICNEAGNVLGMMPHPERAVENLLGMGMDGQTIFSALLQGARA